MPTRIVTLVVVALTAVTATGCGSAGSHDGASSPAPAKLALTATGSRTASGAADAMLYPERPSSYVLDAPLADLGADAPVHRLVAHAVGEDDVRAIADALGVDPSVTRTATGYEVKGAHGTLTVETANGTASVSYGPDVSGTASGGGTSSSDAAVDGVGPTSPDKVAPPTTIEPPPASDPIDVPDEREAEALARSLLDRAGVLAGQQWSTRVDDAVSTAVACAQGTTCPTVPSQVFSRTVGFVLVVDGRPVDGTGWFVTIGEHRRVESLTGVWAAPELVGSYALRPTASVFDDLRNGTAHLVGPQPLTAEPAIADAPSATPVVVHITGVSLGVTRWDAFEDGRGVVYVVPTYRLHASVDGGPPYEIEVLALAPGAVDFTDPATGTPPGGKPLPDPAPERGTLPQPESEPASTPSP